jgi:hypothetical protein
MSEDMMDLRDTMTKFMDAKQEGKSGLVGPSSAGKCYRSLAYRYHGTPASDFRSKDKADLGTLLHLGWSTLIASAYPAHERESDVLLEWPELPRAGEADDVDWVNRIVTDLKSANGRAWQAMVDRGGPYLNYWDQAEMYGLACARLTDSSDWTLRIVLLNTETGERVEFTQPADPERGKALVDALAERHAALMMSVDLGGSPEDFPQEGKGPGRGFPCDWCEWVSRCWPDPTGGLLSPQAATIADDPDAVAQAAADYKRFAALESEAKKGKYDAQAFLRGIVGTFGEWSVSQTKDGEGEEVLDEDAAIAALTAAGIPVPTLFKPGRKGYPLVRRAK